jgi:hypothetical protein
VTGYKTLRIRPCEQNASALPTSALSAFEGSCESSGEITPLMRSSRANEPTRSGLCEVNISPSRRADNSG